MSNIYKMLYIRDQEKAEWGQPEGYPYKEQSETVIGEMTVDAEFAGTNLGAPFYDTDGNLFCIEEGKQYRVVFDGKEYNCVGIKLSERIHYVSATGKTEVSESNVFFYKTCTPTNINERNCALSTLASDSGHTFSIVEVSETIHMMAPEFLPSATTITLGAVKQAVNISEIDAAPTAEQFNSLLIALENAGIIEAE